jgi:hypothetical protein
MSTITDIFSSDSARDTSKPAASNTGLCIFRTDTNAIEVSDGTSWLAYGNDGISYTLSSTTMSVDFNKTGNSSTNEWLQTDYQTTSDAGFTFSAWIKSSTTTNQLFIDNYTSFEQLAFRVNQNGQYLFYFRDTGTGGLDTYFDTASYSASGLLDNNWHHIALTMSGTTVKIYEDGSLLYTDTGTVSYGAIASNFRIGANSGNTATYDGLMDEVAFFERALTAPEISSQYTNKLYYGPSCHFRMGDGPSDTDSSSEATAGEDVVTITDVSGNGYTATQPTAAKKPNYSSIVPTF